MTASPAVEDTDRVRERRAWYGYDWAVSAYVIIVGTVLFSPYLISVSERAACGRVGTDAHPCRQDLTVLGVHASPGSLVFYVVTVATIVSAVTLPVVGAIADRTPRRRVLMCGLGWVGSACAAGMFFVAGTDWELGAVLLFLGNVCLGSSLVVYNAILCDVALPEERDAVSSRGWALGYLGSGILLALDLVLVLAHDTFGLDKALAVRICFVTAGVWWAGFAVIPFRGLRDRPPVNTVDAGDRRVRSAGQSLGQLLRTLRELRAYPVTLLFLVAYLFFNDGIQTVVTAASTYGEKQLGFSTSALIATILLVQFVAFGGALAFGRAAGRFGTHRTIMFGLVAWVFIIVFAFFLPAHRLAPFLVAAVLIGLMLGGSQALSRSFFSRLIPRGREAEYFSLYSVCERGTSWLGTLVFGVVHQVTGSYRPAIIALIAFFVVGATLMSRVDTERGIREAAHGARPVV